MSYTQISHMFFVYFFLSYYQRYIKSKASHTPLGFFVVVTPVLETTHAPQCQKNLKKADIYSLQFSFEPACVKTSYGSFDCCVQSVLGLNTSKYFIIPTVQIQMEGKN